LRAFPNRAADPAQASWLDEAVAASEVYWIGDRAECWDLYVCGVHPDYQAEREGSRACASMLCGEKNRGFYSKAGLTVQVGNSENGLALFTR
jgi:hypothetical protein